MDYFFTIIDEETSSLVNGTLFTGLNENTTLMKHFGPIYIDFDEYHTQSGAISEVFETNINAHIKFDHEYPYSKIKGNIQTWINKESWEMAKNVLLVLSK